MSTNSPNSGVLHSRLFQASAAAARKLAGKTIRVSIGTGGSYVPWASLIRHKLPPDSIALLAVQPERATVLR